MNGWKPRVVSSLFLDFPLLAILIYQLKFSKLNLITSYNIAIFDSNFINIKLNFE